MHQAAQCHTHVVTPSFLDSSKSLEEAIRTVGEALKARVARRWRGGIVQPRRYGVERRSRARRARGTQTSDIGCARFPPLCGHRSCDPLAENQPCAFRASLPSLTTAVSSLKRGEVIGGWMGPAFEELSSSVAGCGSIELGRPRHWLRREALERSTAARRHPSPYIY